MNTCLITLDFINEICHPNGKSARFTDRIEKNNIIHQANRLITWSREHQYLIAQVRLAFHPQYKDSSLTSPVFSLAQKNMAFTANQWGTKFHEQLAISDNDIIINKHRVSAFYGTDLALILRANRIEQLILCGVATNNAVELTAREAHDRDFKVIVVSDASECASDAEQAASLGFLKKIASCITVSELINSHTKGIE